MTRDALIHIVLILLALGTATLAWGTTPLQTQETALHKAVVSPAKADAQGSGAASSQAGIKGKMRSISAQDRKAAAARNAARRAAARQAGRVSVPGGKP